MQSRMCTIMIHRHHWVQNTERRSTKNTTQPSRKMNQTNPPQTWCFSHICICCTNNWFYWISVSHIIYRSKIFGVVVDVIVWSFGLQLPVQSVPIITNVVSSNPVIGELYSMQHYVIQFVSDLRQVGCFLRVLPFPLSIKLTSKVALNTITLTLTRKQFL
jgi:hypothetical protein